MVLNLIKSTWWQLKGSSRLLFPTRSKEARPGRRGDSVSGLFWFDIWKETINYLVFSSVQVRGLTFNSVRLLVQPGVPPLSPTCHSTHSSARGLQPEHTITSPERRARGRCLTCWPGRSYGFLCPSWRPGRLGPWHSDRGSKDPLGGISLQAEIAHGDILESRQSLLWRPSAWEGSRPSRPSCNTLDGKTAAGKTKNRLTLSFSNPFLRILRTQLEIRSRDLHLRRRDYFERKAACLCVGQLQSNRITENLRLKAFLPRLCGNLAFSISRATTLISIIQTGQSNTSGSDFTMAIVEIHWTVNMITRHFLTNIAVYNFTWVSSFNLSGYCLLSSLLTFCWNFFMSNSLNGFSNSRTPLGNLRMSLLTWKTISVNNSSHL